MSGIEPNWPSLLLFSILWIACCVAFLVVVGMFPLAFRPQIARVRGGSALVLWNALTLVMLAGATVFYGATELRWTSLVVAGGVVFLFAPGLFEAWPSKRRDGRSGLAFLLAIQIAALITLYVARSSSVFGR